MLRTSPSSLDSLHVPRSTHRTVRPLPWELKEHCQIYLEEQIYDSALSLLNAVLSAGASRQDGPVPAAVYVPPPSHLAVIATLTVHPLHTTRNTSLTSREVSARAITYLRSVLAAVGPINADFKSAFRFTDHLRRSRGKGRSKGGEDVEFELPTDDRLRGALATDSSLWARVDDLWGAVGWAFLCCRMHPHRWRYWKAWLEFMADLMEADWNERERLGAGKSKTHVRESIIASYLNPDARRLGVLRIVKALLADGRQDHSIVRFSEVFPNEPKRSKTEKGASKKNNLKVDLANGQFGDYYDDQETFSDDDATEVAVSDLSMTDAEIEAIHLRLRFFNLVARAHHELCDSSLTDILYELFVHDLRSLALQPFSLLITAHQSPLTQGSLTTILTQLIQDFLPTPRSDANPDRVDPQTSSSGGISMSILERCYLPFAASAMKNDVRLSLILENMLFIIWESNALEVSSSTLQALETGIALRRQRADGARSADANTIRTLNASAARMTTLLTVALSLND